MAIKTFTKDNIKNIEFDSLYELHSYLKDNIIINGSVASLVEDSKGSSFYGGTYDEFMDEIMYGNEKLTAKFIDSINTNNNESESECGISLDNQGIAYDMGSVVSGEPECCLKMDAPDNKKCVSIYVDMGYCCMSSQDVINNRGIALFNLITTLLTSGVIVELKFVTYFNHSPKTLMTFNVNTKDLCLSEIASYCTTKFWRVGCWALDCILKQDAEHDGGQSSRMPNEIINDIQSQGNLYIGGGYTDEKMEKLNTVEQANEYITELFNKYCEEQKQGE